MFRRLNKKKLKYNFHYKLFKQTEFVVEQKPDRDGNPRGNCKITVTLADELPVNDKVSLQLYNIIFRRFEMITNNVYIYTIYLFYYIKNQWFYTAVSCIR